MTAFVRIEDVQSSPQFGNCGPEGWAFALWGSATCQEEAHRRLIESVAALSPNAQLRLPEWVAGEDCIEGSMLWEDAPVWIWFETVLNFTSFWSANRRSIDSLRAAALPLARAA
jgi:hypothetical protein